jgi:hypothetical protein
MSTASADTSQSLTSAAAPAERLKPFGPPPLIEGDDRAAYDALLAQISGAVKPSDILEDIWVRDIVDLVWEIFRLRRLKVDLMAATAAKGLQKMMEPFSFEAWRDLMAAWTARKPEAIEQVERLLASAGLGKWNRIEHRMAPSEFLAYTRIRATAGASSVDPFRHGTRDRLNRGACSLRAHAHSV